MKQQIMQISNITFKEVNNIKMLKDVTQSFVFEDIRRLNSTISDNELYNQSKCGIVLAQLLNHYDCTYDIEYIQPTDVRYQAAADEIATYKRTDWTMDDADMLHTGRLGLSVSYYNYTYQHTLYMYFDEWTQHGYEALLGAAKWDEALYQVIYEYMRHFLTVEII